MFHNAQETAFGLSMFRDFGRKLHRNSDNCFLNSPNQVEIKSSR